MPLPAYVLELLSKTPLESCARYKRDGPASRRNHHSEGTRRSGSQRNLREGWQVTCLPELSDAPTKARKHAAALPAEGVSAYRTGTR